MLTWTANKKHNAFPHVGRECSTLNTTYEIMQKGFIGVSFSMLYFWRVISLKMMVASGN
jgi:hypothetical protein